MDDYKEKNPFRINHREEIIGPILMCTDYMLKHERLHVKAGNPTRDQLIVIQKALNLAYTAGYETAQGKIRKSLGILK